MERIETRNQDLANCHNTCIFNKKNYSICEKKSINLQTEKIIDELWLEMYLKPKKSFTELKKEIREWLQSSKC